ncbi:MAG: hypothetical protein RL414_107 [Actinomycetota bacterium]
MKSLIRALIACAILGSALPAQAVVSKSTSFQAEIWADNWFALYINGKKVAEDSVPITTERSFNSQKVKFSASYPFTVGLIAKDFTENASGLEYIGKPNQQIGDAGIVLQIREVSNSKIIAYTSNQWKALVINKAPLNPECVTSTKPLTDCKYSNTLIPTGWSSSTFKDSSWKNAIEYSKDEVGVKEGYFDITWSPSAKLIWTSDLRIDNTILLRKIIKATTSSSAATANFQISSPNFLDGSSLPKDLTCDGLGISPGISWSGAPAGTKSFVAIMDAIPGPLRPGEVDIGNHFYLTLFNIPTNVASVKAGNTSVGTLGRNFKDKNVGYTPPCSQGPGTNTYTITLYALSSFLDIAPADASEVNLLKAMQGKILASSAMSGFYTRS